MCCVESGIGGFDSISVRLKYISAVPIIETTDIKDLTAKIKDAKLKLR